MDRLRLAFENATMAGIAKRLGISHATVRNYFGGRLPSPEILIKIANETNVSLNWLLLGKGSMFAEVPPKMDLEQLLDRRISEIVEQKLRGLASTTESEIQNIIIEYDDPHRAMGHWFHLEGREYPQDFGIAFFKGWETFTDEEKLDALKDAKKVLDRTLKNA